MRRLFQLVIFFAMACMLSGTAFAYNAGDHVHQAPNGKGEVLIFPYYSAADGWETKIQVINTSLTTAAVAKVVVRSEIFSQELLDFLIYLTPSDVWEGTLYSKDGNTWLRSTDGSTLTSTTPTWANQQAPFDYPLANAKCNDNHGRGYVEVFLSRLWTGQTPGMSKNDLFIWYGGAGVFNDGLPMPYGGTPAEYAAINADTNILAGHLEQYHLLNNMHATLPATVLANYGSRKPALNPIVPTFFGDEANNFLTEVEAALSKNQIAMPYNHSNEMISYHIFNFPTKMTRLNNQCWYEGLRPGQYEGFRNFHVPFAMRTMDMEERTPAGSPRPIISPPVPADQPLSLGGEVSYTSPSAFPAGWALYTFPAGPTTGITQEAREGGPAGVITYTGAPVIPVVSKVTFSGGYSMMYGAWTDGDVTINGVPRLGYQYISF